MPITIGFYDFFKITLCMTFGARNSSARKTFMNGFFVVFEFHFLLISSCKEMSRVLRSALSEKVSCSQFTPNIPR